MKKIRMGFVGFANGHQNIWLKVFQENNRAKIVAISDQPDFGGRRLVCSLSHERDNALAVVIIEGDTR